MFHSTPSWAARHKYFHHSNPRSGDRAKKLFEKTHVRPSIEWARYVLKDETREADHKQAASILRCFTVGRGSAAMEAGRAVQDACDLHLVPETDTGQTLSVTEACHVAQDRMRNYVPKDWTSAVLEDDMMRKEKYIDEIPKVVEHAVLGLREAMRHDNQIIGETQYIDMLAGNALPHNTLPDYGRRGDLKTKWSRPSRKPNANIKNQTTWTKGSLPSSLTGMFDMNNVYQAAGFYALNGRQPPFLVYANAYDYRVFDQNNTPELRPEFLENVIRDIAMQHKTTENILKQATNKEDLLSLVSPDFNALHWQEPPLYIEEAKKMWGLSI